MKNPTSTLNGHNDINLIQEEVTAAAASSLAAPKHSVSRFQRCYSDGSQGSPNMRRKQLGSASQKVGHISSGHTGFSSEIGTKLRDWAVGQAGGSCYSLAALSSNDSKTR